MIIGKFVFGDILKYLRFRLLEIRELRFFGWKVLVVIMNYYKEFYLKVSFFVYMYMNIFGVCGIGYY